MEATLTTVTSAHRRPAWMLIGSMVVFVAWFAAAMTLLAGAGVTDSAQLTPEKMASIRVGWVVTWLLYAVAVAVGAAGLATVARALRQTRARVPATGALVAAVASIGAIVAYTVVVQWVAGFDTGRLGDHSGWDVAIALSIAAMWATLAAIVLGGIALRMSGVLRRAGLVVAIVAAVVLLTDVVFGGVWPPFVMGLLLLPYGIGLLRRPVVSTP